VRAPVPAASILAAPRAVCPPWCGGSVRPGCRPAAAPPPPPDPVAHADFGRAPAAPGPSAMSRRPSAWPWFRPSV